MEQREIKLQHCPTEEMGADVLTKPKQGRSIREFCSKLMNSPIDVNMQQAKQPVNQKYTQKHWQQHLVPVQECVDTCTGILAMRRPMTNVGQ